MKVPKFKNVKETRKFWDSHESTNYLDDFKEAKDVVFVPSPPCDQGTLWHKAMPL
jgi:hypothetical protein